MTWWCQSSGTGSLKPSSMRCQIKNSDLYSTCSTYSDVEKKTVYQFMCSPPSTNAGSMTQLSLKPLRSCNRRTTNRPKAIPELRIVLNYSSCNPTQSQKDKSSSINPSHAIAELRIMPNPVPALEPDTVSVPTLPPFAPNSDSPSRETRVEGFNPEEHGELSREELVELFGEENMNYIFELRTRQAALTVSRPSPDRRETTAITTSARKSKYKSTDNAGARQPSRPKK